MSSWVNQVRRAHISVTHPLIMDLQGTGCQASCPPNCHEVIREAVQKAWEKLGGHKLEPTNQVEGFHTPLEISLTQLDSVRQRCFYFPSSDSFRCFFDPSYLQCPQAEIQLL